LQIRKRFSAPVEAEATVLTVFLRETEFKREPVQK